MFIRPDIAVDICGAINTPSLFNPSAKYFPMSFIKVPFWKDSIKPVITSPKDVAADLILLIPPPSSINS